MWLEADEFSEIFKVSLPYYLLLILPIFIIISPTSPVVASHEFNIHRMQQYDIYGVAHGCRSVSINLEARSLTGWSTSRHCVLAKLQDMSIEQFRDIRSKAGALLVILPRDLTQLSVEEKQVIMHLEDFMLSQEITIPVYFVPWSSEMDRIVNDITNSFVTDERRTSATENLLNSIAANGYQIVTNPGTNSAKTDIKIATLQGKLSSSSSDGKAPTIAVVAHYDSFTVAPELSYGAISDASGVVVLLELARLFSILYANPKSQGKYNIVFLLTGGGKFNYQGSKKWLEDQLDSLEVSIIQDASYVMCLDSLASNDSLYMHVSKPPKEGSPSSVFFKDLKDISQRIHSEIFVEGVHKKINLAEELLAWEHERFSIRRLPAFTVSSLKTHKDLLRTTIFDVKESIDMDILMRHTEVLAETLVNLIYDISPGTLFQGSLAVQKDSLEAWLSYLTSQPRSAQLLCDKNNPLVQTLKTTMSKYLKDVKVTYMTPDKREPEFMFYDVTKSTINIYSVKPAVFDLILTIVIVLYLTLVYFFLQRFPDLYSIACKISTKQKIK